MKTKTQGPETNEPEPKEILFDFKDGQFSAVLPEGDVVYAGTLTDVIRTAIEKITADPN